MDPIGASCFSLHVEEKDRLEEQRRDERFREIVTSNTTLSRYDAKTFKTLLPQVIAAIIAAGYHLASGISLAFSGILIPSLDRNATDDGELIATKNELAWIASVYVLIVPVGALTGGFIMDSFGRLNALRFAALPSIIGWALIAGAQNVTMLILGRLVIGFAGAWGTSPALVYITEIARADIRGSLIASCPGLASLGMVICFLKGWYLHWRIIAWMSIGYCLIPLVLTLFIPESPVWLVSKGRIEDAAKSLQWIHKYQPQPFNRKDTMAELQLDALQKEHQKKLEDQMMKGTGLMTKLKEFLKPTGYKPILILFWLFFFQQFSGIYTTLFYQVTFFQEVGSEMNPYLASIMIASVRALMSGANTYMMRTFHRRPLVILSGFMMAACMTFSGLFTYWIKEGTSTQSWAPVLLLVLYVVASMLGLLSIPWTMTAELFPIDIRGIAHSFAYSSANLLMFFAIQMYWTLNDWFSGAAGVQWFFAVVSILASIYAFIFLPETHGKKLSEITDYFNNNTIYLGSNRSPKAGKDTQKLVEYKAPKKNIITLNQEQNERLMGEV